MLGLIWQCPRRLHDDKRVSQVDDAAQQRDSLAEALRLTGMSTDSPTDREPELSEQQTEQSL